MHNPEGGLVVFMTSDSDLLRDVNAVVENHNFRAALLFHGGKQMSKAPAMREKAHECYEWMGWLRTEMQMPQLQMHVFNKELEWQSPTDLLGILCVSCIQQTLVPSLLAGHQQPCTVAPFAAAFDIARRKSKCMPSMAALWFCFSTFTLHKQLAITRY